MVGRVWSLIKQQGFVRYFAVALLLQQAVFISGCSVDKAIEGILPKVALPDVEISAITVTEGTSAPLTVSLRKPLNKEFVLNYTTQDVSTEGAGDYTAATGTITFAAGQTVTTVNLSAGTDALYEGAESFRITFVDNKGRSKEKDVAVDDIDTPPVVEFQAPS